MNRSALNFLIDAVAFVAFVFLTTTGILTRYVLPPGSGRWATLWGLDRHGWGDIHFWIAVLLLGVLALHLALHWRWVLCMVRGQRSNASGARVALGLVGVLGLLVLAATPLLAPVEQLGAPAQRSRSGPPPAVPARLPPRFPDPVHGRSSSITPAEAPAPGTLNATLPGSEHDSETLGTEDIRGSMTLREAAASAAVPLDGLIKQLALPADFDPDERIGRLRKGLGISPDDIRRAVREYRATH